jgi:uncharacterized protein YqgC (DUF456 family)
MRRITEGLVEHGKRAADPLAGLPPLRPGAAPRGPQGQCRTFPERLPSAGIRGKADGVWESINDWINWDGVGATAGWAVTVCLLLVGLAGCIIPFLPGHLVILFAAIGHRLMFGDDSGVEWWTFVVLDVLLTVSQLYEWFSGAAGARWFGGTKWGAAGAVVGGIVGLFFMPFGLVLGPLAGAYAFESWFANQSPRPAMVSGFGSAVGALSSLVVKLVVGVMMIGWFVIDVFFVS